MFSSSKVAVISIVAGVVAAQSPIPTGISNSCSQFLGQYNSDSTMSGCTKSMLSSVSSFNLSNANADSSKQALNAFCSAPLSCSEDSIRATLTSFSSNCSAEISGAANKDVTLIYEELYSILPFKDAVCSKGDDGSLCAQSLYSANSSSIPTVSGGSVDAQQVIQNLGSSAPNATTFSSTNLLFLFLSPSTPQATLCTSCSRSIMSAYVSFESKIPFAPGFGSSIMFAGQNALYNAIQQTCGANFLDGKLQAAGSLSGGVGSSTPNGAGSSKVLSSGAAALAMLITAVASAAF